jgi:exosortase/archaeosortase family protein
MKTQKEVVSLIIRYSLLVIFAFPSFWLFYLIFTPLTVYPVFLVLSLFFHPALQGNTIIISCTPIEIIGACVAGSAYYFLAILNLSIPSIKLKKRLKMILFSFSILLFLNVLRIVSLSLIYLRGSSWFDFAHKAFWYTGSVAFVVLIWFAEVRLFKIKQIPIYSDLKSLFKSSSIFHPVTKFRKQQAKKKR